MHSIKAISLIFVASVSVSFASPTLLTRQNGVTCQTSTASPVTGDVTLVINEIRGRGGSCPQTNGKGSGKVLSSPLNKRTFRKTLPTLSPDCTTLVTQGEAAISVCGGTDDDSSALSCADVANFANQIQQTCLNGPPGDANTRTGGTFTVSPSKRVEVINTSSV